MKKISYLFIVGVTLFIMSTSMKSLSYSEKLIEEYGSAEAVRSDYLPSKSELKQYLTDFYFDDSGKPIAISPYSKLHTHRNTYNRGPRTKSGMDNESGRDWMWVDSDMLGINKHCGKLTYRGEGRNYGCQVTYNENGTMDDNTSCMGTFDYAFYYYQVVSIYGQSQRAHQKWDVEPHNSNSNYASGLTTKF